MVEVNQDSAFTLGRKSLLDYPSNYDNSAQCTLSVSKNVSLFAEAFQTKSGFDYLTVNAQQYSGFVGPDGVSVLSDSSIPRQLCV